MFNLIKISQELTASSWDYFLGAFEKIDKNQLNNLMFNNNTQKLLNNIGFDLSNDDFIYLCCLYNNNFQESVKEQIESGSLNKEYVNNTKPNEFVLKYFQLLKKIILSKDFNFINKHITELSFIYNIINFTIYKIKFITNKLTPDSLKEIDKDTQIKLIIYYIVNKNKDKDNIKNINHILFEAQEIKIICEKLIKFIEQFIYKNKIKDDNILIDFDALKVTVNNNEFNNLNTCLIYLRNSLKSYAEKNNNIGLISNELEYQLNLIINKPNNIKNFARDIMEYGIINDLEEYIIKNITYKNIPIYLYIDTNIKKLFNINTKITIEDILYFTLNNNPNLLENCLM